MFSSIKRIGARISDLVESVSNNPVKSLRQSIISGDEVKALEIYTGISLTVSTSEGYAPMKEKGLIESMHPSLPFTSKKFNDQTPLHLATLYCLEKLVVEFLKHGGNPNAPNAKEETCIHSVCSNSDRPHVRFELLEMFLKWKGSSIDGGSETVSINRVDREGNTAIHRAAASGLLECVERLVTLGAIISIVNANQRTCCEMADLGHHSQLARMLELSLVFQPADVAMEAYGLAQSFSSNNTANLVPVFLLDTTCHSPYTLAGYVERLIEIAMQTIGESRTRTETLLFACDWSVGQLVREWRSNRDVLLAKCHLVPVSAACEGKSLPAPNTEADTTPSSQPANSCSVCGDDMSPVLALTDLMTLYTRNPTGDACLQSAVACSAGHKFCLSCWQQNCCMQINQGAACLRCPAFKCGECLDISWAPLLLKEIPHVPMVDGPAGLATLETSSGGSTMVDGPAGLATLETSSGGSSPAKGGPMVARLHRARLRRMLECGRHCRHPSCGLLLLVDTSNAVRVDDACGHIDPSTVPQVAICAQGHAYCLSCDDVAHAPCTCSDWARWKRKVQDEITRHTGAQAGDGMDDVASALWLSANTKQCPKCKTAIEKDEGCNHMNCRKCRHEFCWMCMQPWAMHGNSTGGFFQCNRFVADASSMADGEDEGALQGWEAELIPNYQQGSAQAEALKQRNRGVKMQRFIHHYTRHMAHGESAAKEALIRGENLRRIEKSLRDTSSGELLWLQGYHVVNPLAEEAAARPTDNVEVCGSSLAYLEKEAIILGDSESTRTAFLLDPSSTPQTGRDSLQHSFIKSEGSAGGLISRALGSINLGGMTTPFRDILRGSESRDNGSVSKPEATDQSPERKGIFRSLSRSPSSITRAEGGKPAAGGPDPAQTIITSAPYTEPPACLTFLQEGFDELLRCRQLLKGSFAFAFFVFSDEHAMNSKGSFRRHSMARRARFELLQGELEIMVEMLSDCLARKRLRASSSQIKELTQAARRKRLEWEENMFSAIMHEAMETKDRENRTAYQAQERAERFRRNSAEAHNEASTFSNSSHTTPSRSAYNQHETHVQHLQVSEDILSHISMLVDELSQLKLIEEGSVPGVDMPIETLRMRQAELRAEAQSLMVALQQRGFEPSSGSGGGGAGAQSESSKAKRSSSNKEERRSKKRNSAPSLPSPSTPPPSGMAVAESGSGKSNRRYSSEATIGAVHKRSLPAGIAPAHSPQSVTAAAMRAASTSPTGVQTAGAATPPPPPASREKPSAPKNLPVSGIDLQLTDISQHIFPLPPDYQPTSSIQGMASPASSSSSLSPAASPSHSPSRGPSSEPDRLFHALESLIFDDPRLALRTGRGQPDHSEARATTAAQRGSGRGSAAHFEPMMEYPGAVNRSATHHFDDDEDMELNRAIMLSLQSSISAQERKGTDNDMLLRQADQSQPGEHQQSRSTIQPPITEEQLQVLMSLGYSPAAVEAAWALGGSLDAAANILLNGGVGDA